MSEPTLQDCINYMRSQIRQMEKHPRNYEFNLPYYRKTVELLEKEPRPHGEWIPCSERLPERDEIVLVSFKTGCVHLCKYLDDDSENPWWSYIDDCCAWNNVVDAWMPLPEPYKKEGEAE